VEELSGAEMAEMIEEAIIDTHDYAEQLMGLEAALEESLATPFETEVLGVTVTVESVSYQNGAIGAHCVRGDHRQVISLMDLPLPEPPPEGWEWIAAYRYWASRQ
jgi:hypothetical protein